MHHSTLPRPSTTNILPQLVSTNLLPLDLLPCDRQLPPQTLERTLTQAPKRLVQIFLILPLHHRYLSHNFACVGTGRYRCSDGLGCEESNVAVFVVVYVDVDGASQRAGRGAVGVGGAPSAVPGTV